MSQETNNEKSDAQASLEASQTQPATAHSQVAPVGDGISENGSPKAKRPRKPRVAKSTQTSIPIDRSETALSFDDIVAGALESTSESTLESDLVSELDSEIAPGSEATVGAGADLAQKSTDSNAAYTPEAAKYDSIEDDFDKDFEGLDSAHSDDALDPQSNKRVLAPQADAPKLHKILAQNGMGSRLEMEALILEGRILVNGEPAHLGQRVQFGDEIKVNGSLVHYKIAPPPARVLMYHKPTGEIVTHDDPNNRPTVFRKLPRLRQGKWQSVGRLDINTEGLLLLTNSGELAHKLMHPSFGLEREYAVRVLGALNDEEIARLLEGVNVDGQAAKFTRVEAGGGLGSNVWYKVTIEEGRNREVRKMFEAVGHAVSRLIRIRYGQVLLARGLRRGMYWELSEADVQALGGNTERPPRRERPSQQGGQPENGPEGNKNNARSGRRSPDRGRSTQRRKSYGDQPREPRQDDLIKDEIAAKSRYLDGGAAEGTERTANRGDGRGNRDSDRNSDRNVDRNGRGGNGRSGRGARGGQDDRGNRGPRGDNSAGRGGRGSQGHAGPGGQGRMGGRDRRGQPDEPRENRGDPRFDNPEFDQPDRLDPRIDPMRSGIMSSIKKRGSPAGRGAGRSQGAGPDPLMSGFGAGLGRGGNGGNRGNGGGAARGARGGRGASGANGTNGSNGSNGFEGRRGGRNAGRGSSSGRGEGGGGIPDPMQTSTNFGAKAAGRSGRGGAGGTGGQGPVGGGGSGAGGRGAGGRSAGGRSAVGRTGFSDPRGTAASRGSRGSAGGAAKRRPGGAGGAGGSGRSSGNSEDGSR